MLSPVGLSLTTKLAPQPFRTQLVALFYLSVSLGTALSGEAVIEVLQARGLFEQSDNARGRRRAR